MNWLGRTHLGFGEFALATSDYNTERLMVHLFNLKLTIYWLVCNPPHYLFWHAHFAHFSGELYIRKGYAGYDSSTGLGADWCEH